MNRAIEKGVLAKLASDGTVNGFVAGRYYVTLAPNSASYPFIVLQYSGGGNTNNSPDEPIDCNYIVKAMSPSLTVTRQIADAIYNALHNQTLSYDSPWKHLDCEHTVPFELSENVDGGKVFTRGGIYRIRADKT